MSTSTHTEKRPAYVVHASPAMGGLPASDIESLYLIALVQASLSGGGSPAGGSRWAVARGDYATNGGVLPYTTHLDHLISTRHLPNLPAWSDIDQALGLSDERRAEALSWRAYCEQSLTDFVYHTMYSLPPNYPPLIAPAQIAGLGPLEKQYIPQRIRGIHKARLEHVGLWGVGGLNDGDAQDADGSRRTPLDESFIVGPAGTQAPRAWSGWRSGREAEKRKRLRGEEELRQKVRGVLSVLERRLGGQEGGRYFFGNRTVDLYLFAHLSLLLVPPYPNHLVADLIRSEFPRLVQHHDGLAALLFPGGWSSIPRTSSTSSATSSAISSAAPATWSETIRSYLPTSLGGATSPEAAAAGSGTADGSQPPNRPKSKQTEAERKFARGRWAFWIGAGAAMVGYLLASGLVKIELGEEEWEVGDDEDEEEEEEEEGDEDAGIPEELVGDDDDEEDQ